MRKIVLIGMVLLLLISNYSNSKIYAQEGETERLPIDDNPDQKCGDFAYYKYDSSSRTLNIYGKGNMYDFSLTVKENYVPWNIIKTNILKINIDSGITSIGAYAFAGCTSVNAINFGGVKTIGSFAFKDCTLLKSINISKYIENIALDAFAGCVFDNISVESSNTKYKILNKALVKSNLLIKATNETVIDNSITSINKYAFEGLKKISTLYLPSTVSSITSSSKDESIFKNCSSELIVYTNAKSDLSGWGNYYKYLDQTNKIKVIYNTSYEEYNRILNRITVSFATSGLKQGDTVYLDGQPYILDKDLCIKIDHDLNPKIATSYIINNKTNTDIHTQYPTGMSVYFLKKENDKKINAIKNSNFENILTYAGASIRITGVKGIRTITSIPTNKKNQLINDGIDNYIVVEYGTVICWADTLKNLEEPSLYYDSKTGTYKASQGAKGRAYSRKDSINTIYSETGGITKYTNTLVDTKGAWNDASCKKDFAMRSYIIIRLKGQSDASKDIVVYGGTLYRSISYVALQNKKAFKKGTNGYEYIFKLIKAAYPDVYNNEYGKW